MRKQFETRVRLVIYMDAQDLNRLTAHARREGRVLVAWAREVLLAAGVTDAHNPMPVAASSGRSSVWSGHASTVNIAPPSEEVLLPEVEWKSLSPDSQFKLQTWFRLATERLQAILDSDEFDGDSQ